MLLMKDIIREGHPTLRKRAKEVKIPVSTQDRKILLDLLNYVIQSQNDTIAEQYGLRPGVGLAAPQINVSKRMFALYAHDLEGKLHVYPLINPEIIARSKEMVYIPGGEGCLSVDRETEGITPRHKSITFKAWYYNFQTNAFEEIERTIVDYIAIVFQHELDHLDGVLYTDKLFETIEGARPLWDVLEEDEELEDTDE